MKDLFKVIKTTNEKTLNKLNDALLFLGNDVYRNEIPKNENPDNVIRIFEEIIDFRNQQKCKGLKILTPKQMLKKRLLTTKILI